MPRNEDNMKLVDETMSEVRRNWNIMTQDDYNPITVAMEMLQKSNSAHEFSKFETVQKNLELSMNIIIENYYSGFNSAVSVFGGIVEKINDSKLQVSSMKNELEAFRDQIQYKRTDLPELYSKIGSFKESLMANQKISELSENRSKYLQLAGQKYFISSAQLLLECIDNLKFYKTESCDSYKLLLQEDKKHITCSIFDELIQHIFLKKSATSSQWSGKILNEISDTKIFGYENISSLNLMDLTSDENSKISPEEFDYKPDSNSQKYIVSLLEALNLLGTLEECLESLDQKISTELYLIIEGEIKKSSEKLRKQSRVSGEEEQKYVLIPHNLSNVFRDEFYVYCPILKEMVETISFKFIVILKIFKFITSIISNFNTTSLISDSKTTTMSKPSVDYTNPLTIAISAILREVKSFVSGVIYSGSSSANFNSSYSENYTLNEIIDVLKGKSKISKDKIDIFKATTTSNDVIPDNLLTELKSIRRISKNTAQTSTSTSSTQLNIDPYSSNLKNDLGHKQIVKANIQYLLVLFNPLLNFYEILKNNFVTEAEAEGGKSQEFGEFLQVTFTKEYLPFIENYMIHELNSSFKGIESSTWTDLTSSSSSSNTSNTSHCAVLSSYMTFAKLINEACRFIYFIPSYQVEFEKIMQELFNNLLDKSEIKLRDLILSSFNSDSLDSPGAASDMRSLCFSVQFAKNMEIKEILMKNTLLLSGVGVVGEVDAKLNHLLAEKEALLMERLKGDRSIGKNELISDQKVIRDLALLQRSFEKLPSLLLSSSGIVKISQDPQDKSLHLNVFDEGKRAHFKFEATFDAKFLIFTELLEKLAQTCLFTLHCEVRCHTFYFMDLAFREGTYFYDHVIVKNEPDPYILTWATDLFNLSNTLSDWFPLSKYLFLFDGLSILIDSILVNNFQYIRYINAAGYTKLSTNTTAIIQLLTQILPPSEVALPRSSEYYRLSRIPCDQLMTEIKASSIKFTFYQYKALLDLAYRDALAQESLREAARKTYNNHLTILKYITTDTVSN